MVLCRRDAPGGPDWEERVYRGDETIVSELLPGFAGTVAELWADAELDDDRGEWAAMTEGERWRPPASRSARPTTAGG